MSADPTVLHDFKTDPTHQKFRGTTIHGNLRFEVQYISEITEGIWMGGCENGLVLPDHITDLVSLYPWEHYTTRHELNSFLEVRLFDSMRKPNHDLIQSIASWVVQRASEGRVLVHCQAGLNRSGLVVGTALVRMGYSPKNAIDLMREKRCDAVLCNPSFHEYVWNLES